MQKNPIGQMPDPGSKITIDTLAGMMNRSFTHLDERLDQIEKTVAQQIDEMEARLMDRLDKIQFRLTGQDQRISTLEDRLRQVATKVGMEFGKHVQ